MKIENYSPTGWWRVVGPDGELWAESSDEVEIRQRIRPGDIIQRHMRHVKERWETVVSCRLCRDTGRWNECPQDCDGSHIKDLVWVCRCSL